MNGRRYVPACAAPWQPPFLFPGAVDAAPFALAMLAVTGAALDAVAMIRCSSSLDLFPLAGLPPPPVPPLCAF